MSSIEFRNGSTVSRMYNDATDCELLAVFQYHGDAVSYVEAKIAEDVARDWLGSVYVVVDLHSGKVQTFKAKS